MKSVCLVAARKNQQGFLLPFVVVLMAVLATIAATISQRARIAQDVGEAARAEQQALEAIANAEANFLFRASISRTLPGGLIASNGELLRLDDRPYRTPNGAIIRVMDLRGQANLALLEEPRFRCVLSAFGAEPNQTPSLYEAYLDYRDDDSLRRLNGAEAQEYGQSALPPPRNDALRNVYELSRVFGWKQLIEQKSVSGNVLTDVVAVQPQGAFAINTAAREAIMCVLDVDGDAADRLIEARRNLPLLSTPAVAAALAVDVPVLDMRINLNQGRAFRVRISYPGYSKSLEYNLDCETTAGTYTTVCRLEYRVWRKSQESLIATTSEVTRQTALQQNQSDTPVKRTPASQNTLETQSASKKVVIAQRPSDYEPVNLPGLPDESVNIDPFSTGR